MPFVFYFSNFLQVLKTFWCMCNDYYTMVCENIWFLAKGNHFNHFTHVITADVTLFDLCSIWICLQCLDTVHAESIRVGGSHPQTHTCKHLYKLAYVQPNDEKNHLTFTEMVVCLKHYVLLLTRPKPFNTNLYLGNPLTYVPPPPSHHHFCCTAAKLCLQLLSSYFLSGYSKAKYT